MTAAAGQGSIQGSVLSESDPIQPDLTAANTGNLTVPDPLGDLITRRSQVRILPPAIAALAILLSAYNSEQALDNFLQIAPCVVG